ncbi:MAG TPA: hypothetical protein VEQ63_02735, partial [Bryobacteraceae bacterium]|nr:hypothetical protein [Bryobacteraceae bacterium]
MSFSLSTGTTVRIATLGAALTMAFQVAGKAARDALFLSNFRSRQLPLMIMAAALSAILLGILNSRVLSRTAPGRLIPVLVIFSGTLQALEYFLYSQYPDWIAVAVYIHVVALGAVITSGFWSVINEQLDPYTAKQTFGGVAAAGTVGGIIGGFASERIAAMASQHAVLLLMCGVQVAVGLLLMLLPSDSTPVPGPQVRATDVLRSSKYLKSLTVLVVIGTFSAALLDFVLKVEARRVLGPGESLMRFFAVFHTATAVLAFIVQTLATPTFLSRWGLGVTISTLPASVGVGGAVALLTGGLPIVVIARAFEAVVRASLFRAAYELFYTPMLAAEKRAVKSINDVTFDRLGDGLGGGFAQLVLTLFGRAANPILLATAALASAAGWIVARKLNRAYIGSLERSLRRHAKDVEEPELEEDDATVLPGSVTATIAPNLQAVGHPVVIPPHLPPSVVEQWLELLSGDRVRVRKALREGPALHRFLLPMTVLLLGRRSVADAAAKALEAVADSNVGQLSDWLLDDSTPVAVRLALPPILAGTGDQRAAEALLLGARDKRSDVRYQCALALDAMKGGEVELEAEEIYEVVRHELAVTNPQIQLVSALLGLVLPREPVRIAFEGIGAEDPQLRGLALEYLESALPPGIGEAVLEAVKSRGAKKKARRSADAIQ